MLLALALAAGAFASATIAVAGNPYRCCTPNCCQPVCARNCLGQPCCLNCAAYDAYRARMSNWHGNYYDVAWGTPVALVVPPTAGRQTKWAWGVGNTEVTTIGQQFGRAYPGPYAGGGAAFLPTPVWPSHTDQFGVYYVRGPW